KENKSYNVINGLIKNANILTEEFGDILVLFDTGSDINCINKYVWDQIPNELRKTESKHEICKSANSNFIINKHIILTLTDKDGKKFQTKFYYIPKCPTNFILGGPTMQLLGYEIHKISNFYHQGIDDTFKFNNNDKTWHQLNYLYEYNLPTKFSPEQLPKITDPYL